jgi:hypothetical protein
MRLDYQHLYAQNVVTCFAHAPGLLTVSDHTLHSVYLLLGHDTPELHRHRQWLDFAGFPMFSELLTYTSSDTANTQEGFEPSQGHLQRP